MIARAEAMSESKTTKPDPEHEEAIALANKVLDDASRDPDSDLSMLSRQFLRALEKIEYLESSVLAWRAQANAKY